MMDNGFHFFKVSKNLISPYRFCFLYWRFFYAHLYSAFLILMYMTRYCSFLIKIGDGKTWKNSEYITKNHATED